MIVAFSLPYGLTLEPAQVAALAHIVTPPVEVDDGGKVQSWATYQADLAKLLAVLPGVKVEVQGAGDPRPLLELADAVQALQRRLDGTPLEPQAYVNSRVDVHVPGAALLAIDEVDVLEDCCTIELNSRLADGWRIVAVCPQPDQRRPDYIVGRRRIDDVPF